MTASEDAIKKAVEQFLGVGGTPASARPRQRRGQPPPEEDKQKPDDRGGSRKVRRRAEAGLRRAADGRLTAQGQAYAKRIAEVKTGGGEPMIDFAIYYPTRLAPGSTIDDASRAFPIDGPDKDAY